MTNAQTHRGPDDGGIKVIASQLGSVALGNRRLAILDLSPAGHQPMNDDQLGNWLAYNGEIYNCLELRDELASKGHRFTGDSDTEVLLIGYREWGLEVLTHVRGMFAFALWDQQKQRMLIARDHVGIKPLYFARTSAGFICASEVKALLASGLIQPRIDRQALAGFLAYGAVQEPFTIIEQVKALEPGCWIEVDGHGSLVATGRHWQMPPIGPRRDGLHLIEEGRNLLERAVQRHLLSDVPLGVFLSSGLDSTAVAGLARQGSGQDVHAFTVSFPDSGSLDEGAAAKSTARRLGLVFHEITIDSKTALNWASAGLSAMDQPSADGINTYIVSRAASEAGLTVALSGQGGDEVFGGYNSFRLVPKLSAAMTVFDFVPATMRAGVARAVAWPLGPGRAKKAVDLASVSKIEDSYFMFRRLLSDQDLFALGFAGKELGLTRNFQSPEVDIRHCLVGDTMASIGRLETKFYLGNTLLRDGDVFGMANSLEIRVPFLDREVVEWAQGLPGSILLPKGGRPKHLLRTMCSDLFSGDQLQSPKKGFALPIGTWLQGPLRDLKEESIRTAVESGVVAEKGVREVERAYGRGPHRSGWTRIWALVALGRWLETNP